MWGRTWGTKVLCIRDNFLNRTLIVYALRSRYHKWNLIKLQSFCKAKDTANRTNLQSTDWEKFFTHPTSDRGVIFNIYKTLKKLDYRESNKPVKEWGRAKQRLLNQELLDSWEIAKEKLNILNHHGNANQNNPEIPPHTSQNGQKKKINKINK